MLVLLAACTGTKKVTESKVKEKTKQEASSQVEKTQEAQSTSEEKGKSEITANQNELQETQTKTYGGSLKGEAFISGQNPAPILVESEGVKFNLSFLPQFGETGLVTGYLMKYLVVAKPTSVKNQTTKKQTVTDSRQTTQKEVKAEAKEKTESKNTAKQSAQTDSQTAEQQTTTGSGSVWLWLGACVALLLLALYLKYKN